MTEEIIIDGVDVAECGAYKDKHCKDKTSIMFCDTNLCSNYPYCYYKQFKRLEFELKVTKADYEASEQENKELRQQYNCYACDTCQGKEDYRNMKRHCENAIKIVHKYRSALEEIRDLCIHYENTNDKCVTNCYAHFIVTDLIQNKINEVLNDN